MYRKYMCRATDIPRERPENIKNKIEVNTHITSISGVVRDDKGNVSSKRIAGLTSLGVGLALVIYGGVFNVELAIDASSGAFMFAGAALVGGTMAERMGRR